MLAAKSTRERAHMGLIDDQAETSTRASGRGFLCDARAGEQGESGFDGVTRQVKVNAGEGKLDVTILQQPIQCTRNRRLLNLNLNVQYANQV